MKRKAEFATCDATNSIRMHLPSDVPSDRPSSPHHFGGDGDLDSIEVSDSESNGGQLTFFFARVEALCVQRMHKSPQASEERVTNQVAKQHHTKTNKTPKPNTNTQKTKSQVRNSSRLCQPVEKGETGAMNSAFALSTSSSRHFVILTRKGCSAYSQQSKSFESFERGLLQPRCHASNEATSVKHSVAKSGVARVLEQQLKQRQAKHSGPTSFEFW